MNERQEVQISADPEGAELQNAVTEAFVNAQPFITKHTDPPRESMPLQEPRREQNEHIMQFFGYDHLPVHLQSVSRLFATLAGQLVLTLPRNPERTAALRKLLEAKDAAVRAQLAK